MDKKLYIHADPKKITSKWMHFDRAFKMEQLNSARLPCTTDEQIQHRNGRISNTPFDYDYKQKKRNHISIDGCIQK